MREPRAETLNLAGIFGIACRQCHAAGHYHAGQVASAGERQHRRRAVHRDRRLLGGPAGRNHAGPAGDRRHTNAAFPQRELLEGERPVERVAFAAVVTGEDDQGVAVAPGALQRGQDAADPRVHALHHRPVDRQRSAVGHRSRTVRRVADGFVLGAFPG